jgi:oxaloacetate decarboxylase alpha subunit
LVATLEGQARDTGIRKETLYPLADHFREVKKSLANDFKLNTAFDVDVKVLAFQLPGGMLSNLRFQLEEQGWSDKYNELLNEIPKVRADLGYPPMVTPTSQIVGSMAAMNVGLGERYTIVPTEVADLARGKYGQLPTVINPEVAEKILGGAPRIAHRPADDIPPQLDGLKAALAEKGYPKASMEDILSYALFPEVALAFFAKNRQKA